jgi:hypothetical protein
MPARTRKIYFKYGLAVIGFLAALVIGVYAWQGSTNSVVVTNWSGQSIVRVVVDAGGSVRTASAISERSSVALTFPPGRVRYLRVHVYYADGSAGYYVFGSSDSSDRMFGESKEIYIGPQHRVVWE